MNKTELVAAMAKDTNLSKKDVEAVLKSFIDVVTDELKKGEKIQLVGFGTFEVSTRAADAFAGLSFTRTLPASHASFATVRRLISLDTFRYLSRRIIFPPKKAGETKNRFPLPLSL